MKEHFIILYQEVIKEILYSSPFPRSQAPAWKRIQNTKVEDKIQESNELKKEIVDIECIL